MWMKVSRRGSATRLRLRGFSVRSSGTCGDDVRLSWRTQPKPRVAEYAWPLSGMKPVGVVAPGGWKLNCWLIEETAPVGVAETAFEVAAFPLVSTALTT